MFPPLKSQEEINREDRQRRNRELAGDFVGAICLFAAMYVALLFLPLLSSAPL